MLTKELVDRLRASRDPLVLTVAGGGTYAKDVFARGHGGQLITLLDELDMIVVSVADPLYEFPVEMGWKFDGAVLNVVGTFIRSLPEG